MIRRARPEDGPAVRAFVFATFDEYGIEADPDGLDRDVMVFGEEPEPVDAYVAEVDGSPIGSVMVAPAPDGGGWLSKFFVSKSHRGTGVGRALLARAVQAARDRGYQSLALYTRSAFVEAIHLYEATGWKRCEKTQDGPCDAYYTLALGPP